MSSNSHDPDEFENAKPEVDAERSDAYWRAYEEWKRLPRALGGRIDASQRFTRDEAHERR